jgi:hypothetical protein
LARASGLALAQRSSGEDALELGCAEGAVVDGELSDAADCTRGAALSVAGYPRAVQMPQREVRLVLVDRSGALRGALPWLRVSTPWWQDIAPVVRAAHDAHGVELTVLRLLSVDTRTPQLARVTYLAQTEQRPAVAATWEGTLDEHPLRLAYAKPGGPEADLAWADAVLAEHGLAFSAATQVRTWNLSSLWRLSTGARAVWLKVVPPFFAHEAVVLEALAPAPVPRVLGHQDCRLLMEETPGADLYGATGPLLLEMVEVLVALQRSWAARSDTLLHRGVPDRRGPALTQALGAVLERLGAQLSATERAVLERFVAGLPERFAQVAACGLPDTLVHGDAHPGNFRGGGGARLSLLDWGDCCVGNPLLDGPGFLGRIEGREVPAVRDRWHALWRAAVPGSTPERAAALLEPVAVARGAVVFQGFLDAIEPSEHPYHQDDPLRCLRAAAQVLAAGS